MNFLLILFGFLVIFDYFNNKELHLTTTATEKWHVDLKNLTCLNIENNLVIAFEKQGTALAGKIKTMPLDLVQKWTFSPNGNSLLRKAVIEADEAFYKAYFNREIEEKREGIGAIL